MTCSKTTCSKTKTGTMKFSGNCARYVEVKGRKFYFLSDFEKHYGRGPVARFKVNPSYLRVNFDGNSQTRRVLPEKEFISLIKKSN